MQEQAFDDVTVEGGDAIYILRVTVTIDCVKHVAIIKQKFVIGYAVINKLTVR